MEIQKLSKPKRGRPKGSQNKTTKTLKDRINLFIDRNFDDLQEDFDLLEPRERFKFMLDLFPFVSARMASVQADVTSNGEPIEPKQLVWINGSDLTPDQVKRFVDKHIEGNSTNEDGTDKLMM